MSRPIRSSSRCCCDNVMRVRRRSRPAASGWSFGRPPNSRRRAWPRLKDIRPISGEQSNTHRAGRRRLRGQGVPPRAGWHQSGDRDRPFSDRRGRVPQCAGALRQCRTRRRRYPQQHRGGARLRREPGRCLDRHQRLSRSLHRSAAAAGVSTSRPARRTSRHPICCVSSRSAGRSPSSISRSRAATTSPISPPNRSPPTISPAGSRRLRRRRRTCSASCGGGVGN